MHHEGEVLFFFIDFKFTMFFLLFFLQNKLDFITVSKNKPQKFDDEIFKIFFYFTESKTS